jgi:AbrB family looped-hinge helix DNA binding protein
MPRTTLRVDRKGSVTLPKELRETYGIEPGDTLELVDIGGAFILSPRLSTLDDIASRLSRQFAGRGATLASMLAALREEREKPQTAS